jgi:aminopeptidase N
MLQSQYDLIKLPKWSYAMVQAKQVYVLGVTILCLASCSSIAPLDPKIGNAGNPFSVIAKKTDVIEYQIDIEIFPKNESISGFSKAVFLILDDTKQVELKLDSRFTVLATEINGESTQFTAVDGIITIDLNQLAVKGDNVTAKVIYSGKPHVALNAPWSGGFVWSKTPSGEDWIATAVQGEGCDLFWPCKDHFGDKADRTIINLTVPGNLVAATNGVLQNIVDLPNNKKRYEWLLQVPTSDYNIALNIGPYERIQKSFTSVNGKEVPIEFWALSENVDKANTMIDEDLLSQISFFETMVGPYPWHTEKLGFVETPHLGMEHQTINAYGKKYVRDEHGFDWLLHHELAHEWFGNLMTHKTINDAWLHEGFGLYMQPAYSLYKFGEAAYMHRMYESYLGLVNCKPIVLEGEVTSNEAFNSDIYGKGGWVLHTLRWLIGEDAFWQVTQELVYGESTDNIQARYRSTQEFIDIVNKVTNEDYTWLFDVYLKQAALPELITEDIQGGMRLTWQTPLDLPFPMPVPISINGELKIVELTTQGSTVSFENKSHVLIDPNMRVLRQLPIIGGCEENLEKHKNR